MTDAHMVHDRPFFWSPVVENPGMAPVIEPAVLCVHAQSVWPPVAGAHTNEQCAGTMVDVKVGPLDPCRVQPPVVDAVVRAKRGEEQGNVKGDYRRKENKSTWENKMEKVLPSDLLRNDVIRSGERPGGVSPLCCVPEVCGGLHPRQSQWYWRHESLHVARQ